MVRELLSRFLSSTTHLCLAVSSSCIGRLPLLWILNLLWIAGWLGVAVIAIHKRLRGWYSYNRCGLRVGTLRFVERLLARRLRWLFNLLLVVLMLLWVNGMPLLNISLGWLLVCGVRLLLRRGAPPWLLVVLWLLRMVLACFSFPLLTSPVNFQLHCTQHVCRLRNTRSMQTYQLPPPAE